MFTSNLNNVLDRMFTISQALEDGRVDQDVLASRARAQLWLPAMDLYETEDAFVISTDIPGVHMENVDIQFDRGSLTITGERGATLPAGEKTQLRVFSAERVPFRGP